MVNLDRNKAIMAKIKEQLTGRISHFKEGDVHHASYSVDTTKGHLEKSEIKDVLINEIAHRLGQLIDYDLKWAGSEFVAVILDGPTSKISDLDSGALRIKTDIRYAIIEEESEPNQGGEDE